MDLVLADRGRGGLCNEDEGALALASDLCTRLGHGGIGFANIRLMNQGLHWFYIHVNCFQIVFGIYIVVSDILTCHSLAGNLMWFRI